MARTPRSENATPAVKRELGPLVVYGILSPDADKAEVRRAITKITTNKAELLALLANEDAGASFIKFTVERGKRNSKNAPAAE